MVQRKLQQCIYDSFTETSPFFWARIKQSDSKLFFTSTACLVFNNNASIAAALKHQITIFNCELE
jgi:hypothetical protein